MPKRHQFATLETETVYLHLTGRDTLKQPTADFVKSIVDKGMNSLDALDETTRGVKQVVEKQLAANLPAFSLATSLANDALWRVRFEEVAGALIADAKQSADLAGKEV